MRQAKFDKIVVAELTVNLTLNPPQLQAKALYLSTQSGTTHGWVQRQQWSTETLECLRALKVAMEADFEREHFAEEGVTTPSTTHRSSPPTTPQGGIGEHLGFDPGAQQA